jgi:hypothetical protein
MYFTERTEKIKSRVRSIVASARFTSSITASTSPLTTNGLVTALSQDQPSTIVRSLEYFSPKTTDTVE